MCRYYFTKETNLHQSLNLYSNKNLHLQTCFVLTSCRLTPLYLNVLKIDTDFLLYTFHIVIPSI